MKQYKKNQWKEFRKEVIELDGGRCRSCHRSESDGVVLQVHHKQYIPGRAPWDYLHEMCETLCKGCHASEHGRIPPKNGWEYAGTHDLGDLCGTCELCQSQIRYVFYVSHEKWPTLEVGTVCCDNLTGTETASSLRRKEDRKLNFIHSTRWSDGGDYGSWSIRQKGIDVEIRKNELGFQISMNEIQGQAIYNTLNEAKDRIFDFIDSGDADDFFSRHK